MNRVWAIVLAALLCARALSAAETPTLELIMSDPDWIGAAPEQPWWADDGTAVFYQQKRPGEDIRDVYRLDLASGEAALVDRSAPPTDAGRERVYDRDRGHVAWVDDGDILLKRLADGAVTRITRSVAEESGPLFSADGERLFFQREGQYFAFAIAGGELAQITDVQSGKDPDAEPGFDALRAQQRRHYATLVENKRRASALEEAKRAARGDLPRPLYLGDAYQIVSRHLSPAGGHLALVASAADADPGRAEQMPNYVTEDGYTALREVRTRVNRNGALPQRFAYVVANRAQPGNYEIHRVPLAGGALEQVTDLDGVSSFVLSPDGSQLLVSRSAMDRHADLYLGAAAGGELRQLTDTVSARFAAIDWVLPEIVAVPSSHVDRPIHSKLYLPPDFDPAARYPAVLFVHGAGYTQSAHLGWPYYFREFMFHSLLAKAGYVVLDMDYRGSAGYGRDWRTAIYRNMGHPELEDYLDGIDLLVENHAVDRRRVGIYGGSYGGFMTFMALFRAPGTFAAGAALRPVVDWMHYNDGYTARILNTPEVDPEAYRRSSPISHAEGLRDPLLIAAGMQDDNVFFQDAVLLTQRLIELRKENFELAVYPLEGHAFVHPESWLDEYRRIFRLMETHLK